MSKKQKTPVAPAPGTTEANQALERAQASCPKSAVPIVTEVQTKLEVAQADAVAKLGLEVIKATGLVAEKYFALITYIRKHAVGPKLVSVELTRLGFKRSRISEVNRVAQSSNEVFSSYEAKLIGFDKALQLARAAEGEKAGAAVVLTPAARQLLAEGSLTQEEVEASGDDIPAVPAKKKRVSLANKVQASARDMMLTVGINMRELLPLAYKVKLDSVPGGWLVLRIAAGTDEVEGKDLTAPKGSKPSAKK